MDKVVEVPKERFVEKRVEHFIDRPVGVEKLITREVLVPVEVPVYKNIDYVVEEPVYIENII